MMQDKRLRRIYEDIKDYCNDTNVDVVNRLSCIQDVVLYAVQAAKGLEVEREVRKKERREACHF